MNTPIRRFAVICLSVLPFAESHAAFNPAVVAADAKWVVFADVNSLRNSTLGKEFVAFAQRQGVPQDTVGLVPFDFDKLLATIGNVTAYGANFDPKANAIDGALIIEGTGDLRKIAEGWIAQATLTTPGVKEVTGLPFEAYSFGNNNEVLIGFPPEPIIVISKSAAHLVKARDVFRGNGATLAQSPSSPLSQLLAKAGQAYWIAASVVPTDEILALWNPSARQTPPARILELMNSGLFSIGEERQRTIAHAELVAKSTDAATKLLKIVQGLTAMISLTESNDRQLGEFLASAVIERKDQSVTLEASYSSDRLVQMMKNAQQASRQNNPPRSRPLPVLQTPGDFGTVVSEWKLDQGAAGTNPGNFTLTDHLVTNVTLSTGATITLSDQRPNNKSSSFAIIDSVEIFPMAGGPGLRFEAENMRLKGFFVRTNAPSASGGKVIFSNVTQYAQLPTAQFEFPGESGDYMLKVRYADEAEGVTTLAISVRDSSSP